MEQILPPSSCRQLGQVAGRLNREEAFIVRLDCRHWTRRWILACLLMGLSVAASPAAHSYTGVETTHRVRMYWTTGFGPLRTVDIDLFGEASPRHVANFLRYVDAGAYDDSYIHRSQAGAARFLQGGSFSVPNPFSVNALASDPIDAAYNPVKNEFDEQNGLSNVPTTLAAARTSDPDSATAGWFFNVTDNSAGFDPGPYTVYGEVVTGWDDFSLLASQPVVGQLAPAYAGAPFATAPLVPGPNSNYYLPLLLEWTRAPLVAGDFNLDGLVDAADELVWQAAQGEFGEADLVADANGDGMVDMADHAIWQQNLGMGELKNIAGDYNGNGDVTVADYLWWSTQFGADDILDADGNGDGVVDMIDYTIWRNAFESAGGLVAPPVGATVPEPGTWASIVGLACAGMLLRRRLRR